jgi:signal transduction histidine kinase
VFGSPLGNDGSMLYVAQSLQERHEASVHVAFNTALATLAVALLAHLWLRSRAQRELDPLVRLSQRLAGLDLLAPGATVGAPERTELAPVHAAIDTLAAQLQRRVAHERAFTGHAAHALRTPLAGMDAQLAVALREAPAELQPRLRQVRAAAGRLQRVVAALLATFRSGVALKWQPLDLQALLGRLPAAGLGVVVRATHPVSGDADLVSAALLNLLDNALRHGAQELTVSTPAPQCLRLQDDGPGVPAERRQALQAAIDGQAYQDRTGLGLMLADMVARAHGGLLRLPQSEHGFVVELQFGPAPS